MIAYVHEFLFALGLTLVVEMALLFFLLRKVYGHKEVSVKQILAAGICASALTIPYVWFVFPFILRYPASIMVGELFAFVVEGIFYKMFFKISFKKAFAISLVANLTSYALGRIIRL